MSSVVVSFETQDTVLLSELEVQSASTRFYQIADCILRIEALDVWSARHAYGFISGFCFNPLPVSIEPQAQYTIRVRCGAPLPEVPQTWSSFPVERGQCYMDGEEHYLLIDDSAVFIGSPRSQKIEIWIGDTPLARSQVAFVNALSYGIQAAVRRCHLYPLHAAGVVDPQSRKGALIVGNSGSGKSTLTVRLVANGWHYLSDDLLAIHEIDGAIEARGYRRFFTISETTRTAINLPQLERALGAPVLTDPTKRRLEPSLLFPDGFAESSKPSALFFATLTGADRSEVRSLTPAESMGRLVKLSPWSCYDVSFSRDYLRVLSRLAKQAAGYELLAGRDILDDPERGAALLASHLRS
jgi:hypothetical protein